MLKMKQSILVVLLSGVLSAAGNAQGSVNLSNDDDQLATSVPSAGPTAATLLSQYRGSDVAYLDNAGADSEWFRTVIAARDRAEADLRQANEQLALAREAVGRLLAEIKIEGAEDVDIGGEVRAARTVVAEWQRAVDAVSAHMTHIEALIVSHGGDVAQACEVVGNR
jgi:hypothetical protein